MADDAEPRNSGSSEVSRPAVDLGDAGLDDVSEIGRGAFAVVYRARQPEFGRSVAVKVLTGAFDDQARGRLDRERKAMGALSSHPNIVAVYGSGATPDGRPYIVMEFAPGGSLADRLSATGPVPWAEAMTIGAKLADALGAAHNAGVLHRDIKPENVLVSQYGEPMLADFGIARMAGGSETRTGVVTASLAHAAPEVLEGQRPTEASDVYGLASTVYALVDGHSPFVRDTDESMIPVIARVATEPPPDLRPRGVPDAVCSVLEKGLAKGQAQRYESAPAFAAALRDAAAGRAPNEAAVTDGEPSAVGVAAGSEGSVATAPRAGDASGRHVRVSRRAVVVAVIIVVIAAAAGLVAVGGGSGDGGSASSASPTVVASVDIDAATVGVAGEGAAWVQRGTGLLDRVDLNTNKVVTEIEVGGVAGIPAMTTGEGSVWVSVVNANGTQQLQRIEPATNTIVASVALPVDVSPNRVATGEQAVWLTTTSNSGGHLLRIDPVANQTTVEISTGSNPLGVAVGFGKVWVADSTSGTLFRVDPATVAVDKKIQLGRFPALVATGSDAMYVFDLTGTVFRVDPKTGKTTGSVKAIVSSPLQEGGTPDVLAAGAGKVWLLDSNKAKLVEVDQQSLAVVARISVGRLPLQVFFGEGSVWVVDLQSSKLFRIQP